MASRNRAKKSRANSRQKNNEGASTSSEEKTFLGLEDVKCNICLNFMIKPVSLPCSHNLCYTCFQNCLEKSNLSCPMCRKRFSVWCRQATKDKKIVNEKLWAHIQAQFPDQVKAALEGEEEAAAEEDFPNVTNHQFAEPGELKREYEAEQARLREEEEKQRKKEEKASADILAELAREQNKEQERMAELERIRLQDEALVLELANEQSQQTRTLRSSSFSSSGRAAGETPTSSRKRPRKGGSESKSTPATKKINSFFPTRPLVSNENDEPSGSSAFVAVTENIHESKDGDTPRVRRNSSPRAGSSGSIDNEVAKKLHFRPISAAPLTPPKCNPTNGQILKPEVVAGTAKNLSQLFSFHEDESDVNHNSSSDSTSAIKENKTLAEELQEMEQEWLKRKGEQEEADREVARQLQKKLDGEARTPLVNRTKGSKDEYKLRTQSANKSTKKQSTIEDSFQKPMRKFSTP